MLTNSKPKSLCYTITDLPVLVVSQMYTLSLGTAGSIQWLAEDADVQTSRLLRNGRSTTQLNSLHQLEIEELLSLNR